MSLSNPTPHDFRQQDLLWQTYETDLERLAAERKRLSGEIQRLTNAADQQNAYAILDAVNAAEGELIRKQQDVEEWLIENNAPGWTNTQ